MKILLYARDYETVKQSGVGKAIDHQKKALSRVCCDFTTDDTEDFDLVHINTVFPASVRFARKAHRMGKKVVYHAHSTKEDFKNSFIFSNQLAPLFKRWLIHCYKQGDVVLTPTTYSRGILSTYGLDRPIKVVSNGIDLSFWRARGGERSAFYKRYALDPSKKSILSVGLPIKRKGMDDFIALAQRLPQYEFVWFGKLDRALMSPEIKRMLEEKTPNLHCPGYISSDLLREAYCGADLYTFLTREETEGIVLLEALACRSPILVRDIPIFEEDYQAGVQLYKGRSVDDFEEKIKSILEGRVPSLTEAGYQVAASKSIEKTGQRLVQIYEALLKKDD